MNITIEKRDLFTMPQGYYLAHCISADFALGAGIAKVAVWRSSGQTHHMKQHYLM